MKRVLIVEDSPTMRLFIKMFLRGVKNISVTEAVDGIDAIEKLNQNSFDLIITDINMPRLNGLELIEKIRGEMISKIPIIILTTKGEESEIKKGLIVGADSYLTKPIIGPILTNLVSDHLQPTET